MLETVPETVSQPLMEDDLAGFVAQASEDERAEAAETLGSREAEPEAPTSSSSPATDERPGRGPADGPADDFLSQLANLSPKAAAAIEATADESPEGDEEINRNLLLKFLSSAKN